MRHVKDFFLIALPGIMLLLLWQFAVQGNSRGLFLYASPALIAQQAVKELQSAAFYNDIWITFLETLLGLISGILFGFFAGLLLWGNGHADKIARPYVILLSAIPVFALAPIFIMWFGIGLLSKTIMAGFAVFFVSLVQSYSGAKYASEHYLAFARNINANHWRTIRHIVIPGALDWVFSGIKISISFALTGAFIGEFISSEKGLGHYILTASSLYDMPRVFWGVIMMALFALLLTHFADWTQKKIQGWKN